MENRGKIPEFQMRTYRYTDRQREAVAASRPAAPAAAPAPEAAAPAVSPIPAPVQAARNPAEMVAALAQTMQPVIPQPAKVPVKDVPSAQVIEEVVRRSLGRL